MRSLCCLWLIGFVTLACLGLTWFNLPSGSHRKPLIQHKGALRPQQRSLVVSRTPFVKGKCGATFCAKWLAFGRFVPDWFAFGRSRQSLGDFVGTCSLICLPGLHLAISSESS